MFAFLPFLTNNIEQLEGGGQEGDSAPPLAGTFLV